MTKLLVDTNEVCEPAEAAKLIGIGYATLYRWIKAGKLIPIRLSGRTLIPQSEIERLKRATNERAGGLPNLLKGVP